MRSARFCVGEGVRGQAETVGQGHRDRAPTKIGSKFVVSLKEAVCLKVICLLHSFDSRPDMSACDRYSGAPHIRDAKNL